MAGVVVVVVVKFVCCSERGNKQTIETYLLQFGKSERNMYGRMDGRRGFALPGTFKGWWHADALYMLTTAYTT